MKDAFVLYKDALKLKYEVEVAGISANFLAKPTTAKLRDLCIQICREKKPADLAIFRSFLELDFDESSLTKIKSEKTDKFKPLVTFLKNKTELSDYDGADMIALLLDFRPRPYREFSRQLTQLQINKEEKNKIEQEIGEIKKETTGDKKDPPPVVIVVSGDAKANEKVIEGKPSEAEKEIFTEPSWKFWQWKGSNKLTAGIAILLLASVIATISYKALYPGSCMQWQNDHYDEVICEQTPAPDDNKVLAMEKDQFTLKKIFPTKETVFFIDGKPVVWYSKQSNVFEFFNQPGYHPITEKELKPVSRQILTSAKLNPLEN